MKYRFLKTVCIAFTCWVSAFSCAPVAISTIPATKVNFMVLISGNSNLNYVGGCDYFTGGISGIVIYRLDITTFYAYDRACPYDWNEDGYVVFNSATLQLKCESCGSVFNVLNGYPFENSKADAPLRSYKTQLIDDLRLQVSN